ARLSVSWSPTHLEPLLLRAEREGFAILKLHSHPNSFAAFSKLDDSSDRDVFASVFGWLDSDRPHVSAVVMPSGEILGRAVHPDGRYVPLRSTLVVGDDAIFFDGVDPTRPAAFEERHAQLFGCATTSRLRRLCVCVVGCSGTGSVVIEQLARLGVGMLILVDPDRVEERN